MRKSVRTPPILMALLASRGKPAVRQPTSEVVPPISTTMAFSMPARMAAPRRLFVGPEANESTGKRSAYSAAMTVPSFWVTNRRASSPLLARPSAKARVVRAAKLPRPALSSVTFSRPSSPMRPRSCEQVTTTSGTTSRTIAATSSSAVALSGENTEQTATLRMPDSRMARAASCAAARSSGTIGRPSTS